MRDATQALMFRSRYGDDQPAGSGISPEGCHGAADTIAIMPKTNDASPVRITPGARVRYRSSPHFRQGTPLELDRFPSLHLQRLKPRSAQSPDRGRRCAMRRVCAAFCSTISAVTPSSLMLRMTENDCCTIVGVRRIEGLSRSPILDFPICARPIASICCSPPDKVVAG